MTQTSVTLSIPEALQMAINAQNAGQLDQAEMIYQQILSSQPDNVDANHLLGLVAKIKGDTDKAIRYIKKSLKINPQFFQARNNLGLIYLSLNKYDKAEVCFRRVTRTNKAFVDGYLNLGSVLQKKQQADEAYKLFKKTLKLNPECSAAYNNIGLYYKNKKQLENAVRYFKHAIELKPDSVEAYSNLGLVYQSLGEDDQAKACFDKLFAIDPNFLNGYCDQCTWMKEQRQLHEALECYNDVLVMNPDFSAAYYNKAVILQELGEMKEAVSFYEKALSFEEQKALVYHSLTVIKKYDIESPHVKAMLELYEANKTNNEKRMHLGFALAKVLEDAGQYEKSFEYLLEANRLKCEAEEQQIKIQEYILFFDKIKTVFSEDFVNKNRHQGYKNKTPVFILGMPRSGTTLVEQILSSHSQVYGAGELEDFKLVCGQVFSVNTLFDLLDAIANITSAQAVEIGKDYVMRLKKLANGEPYIINKMPTNYLFIGIIRLVLPNAKIIHCIRNPMDNCLSIFKNYFLGEHLYAYDLNLLGNFYLQYQDLMRHWHNLFPGKIYNIEYEQLISDQRGETAKLLQYCELEWQEQCLDFHKTERQVKTASVAQVRKPINNKSVELWKRYEKQLQPLYEILNG